MLCNRPFTSFRSSRPFPWALRHATRATAAAPTTPSRSHKQLILEGQFYEDIVEQLAQRALGAMAQKSPGHKLIVGIAGAPGSGKSTLAGLVANRINEVSDASGDARLAVTLPMDGFHYYRSQLDAFPEPQAAHARRGAHWTFDGEAFVRSVRRVREEGEASCPSFQHGKGDPVENSIQILQSHRIVLVEGNYVLLDQSPWDELQTRLLDDAWFVDVDLEVAMARVYARQVGNGRDPEVVKGRIAGNDRPNAELVEACKKSARVVVPSSIPFRPK